MRQNLDVRVPTLSFGDFDYKLSVSCVCLVSFRDGFAPDPKELKQDLQGIGHNRRQFLNVPGRPRNQVTLKKKEVRTFTVYISIFVTGSDMGLYTKDLLI